ncbi:MAG: 2-hydroxyglutaryl-CoA dehydratase [Dehalococcoidales bacterium]|nr:2-hydroxyglutaryl-CoA dehydratase [Dehalococcoidales bacterium]
MKITAGIDIGSMSTKVVLMKDNEIISWGILPTGINGAETAGNIIRSLLEEKEMTFSEIQYIVSTGYGRFEVPFAQKNITEISCHARGANWLCPEVRTILDMGGQDCKAIRCDEGGHVLNFAMNDKCAAGTGRYLERVAKTLEVPIDQIGPLSLQIVDSPVSISNYCAVFAQNDILVSLREGKHINDILAGAHDAICSRAQDLFERVGLVKAFMITGGIAKNAGVVKRIEAKVKMEVIVPFEPQIAGALGAAIFAQEKLKVATSSDA